MQLRLRAACPRCLATAALTHAMTKHLSFDLTNLTPLGAVIPIPVLLSVRAPADGPLMALVIKSTSAAGGPRMALVIALNGP